MNLLKIIEYFTKQLWKINHKVKAIINLLFPVHLADVESADSPKEINANLRCEDTLIFHEQYYLEKYPDIAASGIEPLYHYINYGIKEGRFGYFNINDFIQKGEKEVIIGAPVILIVCHEASRTGAPILGLELARYLGRDNTILVWIYNTSDQRKREIQENFLQNSSFLIRGVTSQDDFNMVLTHLNPEIYPTVAICNSACTLPSMKILSEVDIPVLSLVHEYADYGSSLVLGCLDLAEKVIFPSNDLLENAVKALREQKKVFPKLEKFLIMHQGKCNPPLYKHDLNEKNNTTKFQEILSEIETYKADGSMIVLGCGSVEMRKGVDYFIQIAQLCKKKTKQPIKFIWIGHGYQPDQDFQYSLWLKLQVERSNLSQNVFFFDAVDNLDPFFALADALILSSRLDPFPNVAIDAVISRVPVVAFEKGTGFAEFIETHPIVGKTVPYLDFDDASNAILSISEEKKYQDKQQDKEYHKALQDLEFGRYAAFIQKQCLSIVKHLGE